MEFNYTWEIVSVDEHAGTMVVKYLSSEGETSMNVPLPTEDKELSEYLKLFVPAMMFEPPKVFASVSAGATGAGTITPIENTQNLSLPTMWTEEALRTLILEVLQESTGS